MPAAVGNCSSPAGLVLPSVLLLCLLLSPAADALGRVRHYGRGGSGGSSRRAFASWPLLDRLPLVLFVSRRFLCGTGEQGGEECLRSLVWHCLCRESWKATFNLKEVRLTETPAGTPGPGLALLKQRRDHKTLQLAEALLLSPSPLAISIVSGW